MRDRFFKETTTRICSQSSREQRSLRYTRPARHTFSAKVSLPARRVCPLAAHRGMQLLRASTDEAYPVYRCTPDLGSLEPTDLPPTPWIPIDPTEPASSPRNRPFGQRFSRALPPLTVEVHEGETLYLPAGWFHHVAQRANTNSGLCVCVNWWYESETAFR